MGRFSQDESPLLTARFEYVKSNIVGKCSWYTLRSRAVNLYTVAIAQYFSAWHSVLVDAASAAKDAIEPIIKLIDVQKKQHGRIAINAFLTVLGLALYFIPVIGPEAGLAAKELLVANAAISGVKAVPDMAKKLWPTGGDDTVEFQTDLLTDLFDEGLLRNLKSNFNDSLSVVQGLAQPNTSAFLAFAGQGVFSAPAVQGPATGAGSEEQQKILKQSMTTFLVSMALAQNDWQALLVPGVDAEGLYNRNPNKACPDWASSDCNDDNDAMGCHSHDNYGQCQGTYWWYSVE